MDINIADFVNGSFEAISGILIWKNVKQLWKDQMIRGVHWIPTAFFTAWGFWNLYYYPHLDQWWSFVGGLSIVTANATWLSLMWAFRHV